MIFSVVCAEGFEEVRGRLGLNSGHSQRTCGPRLRLVKTCQPVPTVPSTKSELARLSMWTRHLDVRSCVAEPAPTQLSNVESCTKQQSLGVEERQQVSVQLVFLGHKQAMRTAFVDHELRILDDFCREVAGDFDRYDLIIAAMHDQCRHGDFLQILPEVGLGECAEGIIGSQ